MSAQEDCELGTSNFSDQLEDRIGFISRNAGGNWPRGGRKTERRLNDKVRTLTTSVAIILFGMTVKYFGSYTMPVMAFCEALVAVAIGLMITR